MLGIHDLALFIVSGLLLNLMPGPDSLLIMSRSATQGWRAGSAAALGIGAGTMLHVLAAAIGLSAMLAASATAFTALKWIGAGYIIYIGIGLVRSQKMNPAAPLVLPALPYRTLFFQGFLSNLLNPKVALFFLAFVPQFIVAGTPGKALAFIILGCIFNLNGMLWCHALAVFSAFASTRMQLKPAVAMWLKRSIGGVFVALGLKLALSK